MCLFVVLITSYSEIDNFPFLATALLDLFVDDLFKGNSIFPVSDDSWPSIIAKYSLFISLSLNFCFNELNVFIFNGQTIRPEVNLSNLCTIPSLLTSPHSSIFGSILIK